VHFTASALSLASIDVIFRACRGDGNMRTTLAIDDELLERAMELTGLKERTVLVREGLRALIERESARRLARLGGSEPQLEPVPRRRAADMDSPEAA
jgi:Arc/MetJ family transcription regulator